MLLGSALLGFQSDAYAQAQRGGSRTSSSSSQKSSVSRPSGQPSKSSATVARPSGQSNRPSGSTARPSGQKEKPSGTVARPSGQQTRPSGSTASKPSGSSVSRPSGKPAAKPSSGQPAKPATKPAAKPATKPAAKPTPGPVNKPIGVNPPGSRPGSRPGSHPGSRPVATKPYRPTPPSGVKVPHRPPVYVYPSRPHYGTRPPRPRPGVVIRPYYGTIIAHKIAADMAWTAVRLSYYASVARTYDLIVDNNAYIAQQNEIIAQNNAIIAAQNQAIAQSDALAQAAYTKAQRLGLVQSYAAADMEYYYQNGVFYVLDLDGEYRVIVPPAGALVDSLPSDKKTITLGGEVFFQVDDTVYQSRNIDGVIYFEVLGQLYK